MLFSTKGVVAERIEANGRRLIRVECLGEDRPIRIVLLLDESAKARTEGALTYGYEVCSAVSVTVDIVL